MEKPYDEVGTVREDVALHEALGAGRVERATREVRILGEIPIVREPRAASRYSGSPKTTLKFYVEHPGEKLAGIQAYSDDLSLTIDSGDPGGEAGEFAQTLLAFLREWYAGARVTYWPDGSVHPGAFLMSGDPVRTEDGFCLVRPAAERGEHPLPAFWINEAQFNAVNRKFLQNPDGSANFISFRRRLRWGMNGELMLYWCGMWLGIERDGYCHS